MGTRLRRRASKWSAKRKRGTIGRYKQKRDGAPLKMSTRVIWCPGCFRKQGFCACSANAIERERKFLERDMQRAEAVNGMLTSEERRALEQYERYSFDGLT